MAAALPDVELEDVGPDEDCDAVRRADRPPSDLDLRSVYAKLNYKIETGMTFTQLRTNNVLPKFQTGKITLGIPKREARV